MTVTAGIIAAGEGSRLAQDGAGVIKPLVLVAGRPLSHWVVDGLSHAGAQAITVLTNSRGGAVAPSLVSAFPHLHFDFITADTASSFESFRLVGSHLTAQADDCLISTTDALIRPNEVATFMRACRASKTDAGLALTNFIDDEKPLWVDTDAKGQVTAIGDDCKLRRTATCGLYYLTRAAAQRLPAAKTHQRLRDYWISLITSGTPITGVVLSKTIDVDRPQDLAAAELFLNTEMRR